MCAVAKLAMVHRHVAEALPPPSLATSYRFCFLPCRRDPSSATNADAPTDEPQQCTNNGRLPRFVDRQTTERERGRESKRARGGGTWMNGCNEMELRERTTTRASERASACTQTENTVHSLQSYPGSRGRKNRRESRDGLICFSACAQQTEPTRCRLSEERMLKRLHS